MNKKEILILQEKNGVVKLGAKDCYINRKYCSQETIFGAQGSECPYYGGCMWNQLGSFEINCSCPNSLRFILEDIL